MSPQFTLMHQSARNQSHRDWEHRAANAPCSEPDQRMRQLLAILPNRTVLSLGDSVSLQHFVAVCPGLPWLRASTWKSIGRPRICQGMLGRWSSSADCNTAQHFPAAGGHFPGSVVGFFMTNQEVIRRTCVRRNLTEMDELNLKNCTHYCQPGGIFSLWAEKTGRLLVELLSRSIQAPRG